MVPNAARATSAETAELDRRCFDHDAEPSELGIQKSTIEVRLNYELLNRPLCDGSRKIETQLQGLREINNAKVPRSELAHSQGRYGYAELFLRLESYVFEEGVSEGLGR